MPDYEVEPPFELGRTFFTGATADSADAVQYEGREYIFQDNVNDGFGTGRTSRMRVVRNTGALTLERGRALAIDNATTRSYGTAVNGYLATTAQKGYVLDHRLTAGLLPNDLGYMCVEGLQLVRLALSGAGGALVISPGDRLVSVTAATTGATTAGRVAIQAIDNGTTANSQNASQIQNVIATAMSGATTGNTNSLLLVDVKY